MENLQCLINHTISIALDINRQRRNGVNEFILGFNTCPEQWIGQTKKFIEVVRSNIADRYDYISELQKLKGDINSAVELDRIISKLEELDKRDNLAADIYGSILDEGL
jgi:NCAIR mutase (PurE)-related protein